MLPGEYNLLLRDKIPIATKLLEHQATDTRSLTSRIMQNQFGSESRQHLILRKAIELTATTLGYWPK